MTQEDDVFFSNELIGEVPDLETEIQKLNKSKESKSKKERVDEPDSNSWENFFD